MENLRFLLTDTLPYEMPLIFSNIQLYKFIIKESDWGNCEFSKVSIKDTEPYRFNIKKNGGGIRKISLMHPLSQLQTQKFIDEYGKEFIDFTKTNRTFSIRYPYAINFKDNDVSEKLLKELEVFNMDIDYEDLNEDKVTGNTFFRIKDFAKITDFYKSNRFRTLEVKFIYMGKIDIKSCFDSIYTHSLEWAYFGNKYIAKDYIGKEGNSNKRTRFSKSLDKVVRASNHAETNGILIGPEFSRTVSELLLCRIDKTVHDLLSEKKIRYKHDYEVIRFMDDIFVFSNDSSICDDIRLLYTEVCLEYKLHINNEKSYSEKKPFLRNHLWVTRLKDILTVQKNEIENGAIQYEDLKTDDICTSEINLGLISSDCINFFKQIIVDFEEQESYIVSYVMRYAERNVGDLIYFLNKYDDRKYCVTVVKKYIEFIQYVISYSLTAGNVMKYCKIMKAFKSLLDLNNQNKMIIEDFIFKKTLDIIMFNSHNPIEIQNLIILLKFFNNNIPETVLNQILDNDSSYFVLATISYYISNDLRPRYYKKTRVRINRVLSCLLDNIDMRYSIKYNKNEKDKEVLNLLLSQNFYMLHDFRSLKIVSKGNKEKLDKIFESISCNRWEKNDEFLIKKFLRFIDDKNNSFINWDATEDEILVNVIKRSMDETSYE